MKRRRVDRLYAAIKDSHSKPMDWGAIGFPSAGLPTLPQPPLVTGPRCTTTPACGHCWYCQQRKGQ